MYLLYTAELCPLMTSQGLLHQLFADDVQDYIHSIHQTQSLLCIVQQMRLTIDVLSSWMASSRLLSNPSMTQFIWLGGRRQLDKIDLLQLAQVFPEITFSLKVRDLGFTLEQEGKNFNSLSQHVNLIYRSCYCQLQVVSRSLSHDALVVLVHAFVTSRIDHCCSILGGLPHGVLGRLDRVLHSAVQLIGRIPKFGSVSAYMRHVLHWLPVAQRIPYWVAALVSRCILGCAPSYLCDLCRPVSDVVAHRALCSATMGQLLIPRARLTAMQR